MRKITEEEYQKWKLRFEEDSSVIFSLLNVIDNNLVDSGMTSKGVAGAAIACNARLLKERHGIGWEGFYNWKELFEVEL